LAIFESAAPPCATPCQTGIGDLAESVSRGGGLAAIHGITTSSPTTACVVLSVDEFDSLVRELMLAGAITYVRKGIRTEQLTNVLLRAIEAHTSTTPAQLS
jgi:DNA-binding NarL/FixJ family response regulator